MRYIYFVVNPISGKGTHSLDIEYLKHFFPENYKIEAGYTTGKAHASHLAALAVKRGADCVVACGGDGTVNEVASELVGTSVALGIIPVGSGNGLAGNLAIQKNADDALRTIAAGNTVNIDVGQINNKYFFSNCGAGLDAEIIKKYEQQGKRTLISYVKASLAAAFSYSYPKVVITYKENGFEVKPLMLFISNSNEMGYNMSLTPKASLQDGLLDVVIVPKLNIFYKLQMGLMVLLKRFHQFSRAKHILLDKVTLEFPGNNSIDVQLDGEYYLFDTNKLTINIQPGQLKVIV